MATPIDPTNVLDFDQPLNTDPTYSVSHTFSTADIVGTFDGLRQADILPGETSIIDFTATPKVDDGVNLYPINSEFGFIVTDFEGAEQKDFVANPEYTEGWAGDITGAGGEQIGLSVSDAPTDTFKTPALLGTWLAGIGGNTVKASTEHYSVMQHVLSNQRYPDDPDASYPLDDNLKMVGGKYDGMYIADILPLVGDSNGDGVEDIKDVLQPNESTITENIAVSDDYSVTLKDDGKLLYRWGNTVKRPNDVRIEAEMDLPDEWKDADPTSATPDLVPLFRISNAELVVHHTITNNPNDQIRPEDYENESAIGTLPTYETLPDGKWVSTDDYYSGDGTFYPAGTVLRDPALADIAAGSTLASLGATSSDLDAGFTNAWYTTMDREPFEPVLNDDGTEYITGPRWRLLPDKYGQDLPSVVIPLDPSAPPPPKKGEEKYEVGAETQTVINLLDWEDPVSPLALSAGWLHGAGTTTANGVTLSENFDLALYIKGDVKPAQIYSAELLMDYEEVAIGAVGANLTGGGEDDYLVGQGNNSFTGGAGADLFVLSYGATDTMAIQPSTIADFEAGVDTLGLIDLDVNSLTFDASVDQELVGSTLTVSLHGQTVATLAGQSEELGVESFLVLNPQAGGITADSIIGTENNDELMGTNAADDMFGLNGNDTLVGLGEDDALYGGWGDDRLQGGTGADTIFGEAGNDRLYGGSQNDSLIGGLGNDIFVGGAGADTIDGGDGIDRALYTSSNAGVVIDLAAGTATGGHATGDVLTGIERLGGSNLYADQLTGDDGNNLLLGYGGNDTLDGGLGNDSLQGGTGADTIIGGAGIDSASYYSSTAGVTIDLAAGTASGGEATGDVLTGIERLIGSKLYDDTLTGNDDGNLLRGFGGADVLDGGAGNDYLYGGSGADTISGGAGTDWAVYYDSDAGVFIDLAAGTASGGHATGDVLTGIEQLVGSNLYGDMLTGSDGDNLLRGFGGDDILSGGLGDDVIEGGEGRDIVFGGAGADTFQFAAITDTGTGVDGRDRIADFARTDGDLLDLASIDADFGSAGDQSFTFAGTAFTGNAGELTINAFTGIDTSGFVVAMDINGDAEADGEIYLQATLFDATDMIL